MGNAHPNIVPYQTFETSAGHVMIAVGSDAQYAKLCTAIGRPELAADPAYRANADRVRNRARLVSELQAHLGKWDHAELLSKLDDAGVPAGPVNTLEKVFADPQVIFRGMRLEFPVPEFLGGLLPGLRTPIRLSSSPLHCERPAPRLGEHTVSVAQELGLSRGQST
jgi:crotonobetainyl-CoA:carnitine CoA-transferase CaiB-like acyl-CoA transferase